MKNDAKKDDPKSMKIEAREPPASLAILSRWVPTNQQKDRGLYSDDPTRRWAVGPANYETKGNLR